MTLLEQFVSHIGRNFYKPPHYLTIYAEHFKRFRINPITILEIGVHEGGSLQLWKHYFHPDSTVLGIDCNSNCKSVEEKGIYVRIGDQNDTKFLQSVVDEFGKLDIVIDDGSHRTPDVRDTFKFIYPHVCENGLYAIEDVATSYMPEFAGGLYNKDTFIEHTKTLIDGLHGYPDTEFTNQTDSIHVYKHLIIVEKGKA